MFNALVGVIVQLRRVISCGRIMHIHSQEHVQNYGNEYQLQRHVSIQRHLSIQLNINLSVHFTSQSYTKVPNRS